MSDSGPSPGGMRGALDGITVLDLSRVLAGPYCAMLLGDLGARVIKVERQGMGDETRQWGPPFTSSGESAYYLCANRNKESITLDLKAEAGREVLRDLVQHVDVLIENFKVGTMERLGIGCQSLRALNPGLIYCAITGYGQSGPYRDRPGYDTVIQAQGGLMSVIGPPDGEAYKVGVAIVDVTAGLNAATAILAALYYRERTGEGQAIDIALFDTQLGWLINVASAYLVSGEPPRRFGNAHPTIVPYQPLRTADGQLMLAVGNDSQFAALCNVLDAPKLAKDARFATNPDRVAHREELVSLLTARLLNESTDYWIPLLLEAGVPVGAVNDIPTALESPQAMARQMVQEIEGAQGERLSLIAPVPKLTATPASIRLPPPLLGQHTEEVLRDLLGYDEEQIAALRDSSVV